ncbi:hypothetical protein FRC09_002675 [Ceratobasidium sp. 395]|nr:hypothetical protein FRC09_002675 [Ceratobasidium sp. 395]
MVERDIERVQRGEEKRERQLLLDMQVVTGEKGLSGLADQELFELAKKAMERMSGTDMLEGKPKTVEFKKAVQQSNRGVLYKLNSKEGL